MKKKFSAKNNPQTLQIYNPGIKNPGIFLQKPDIPEKIVSRAGIQSKNIHDFFKIPGFSRDIRDWESSLHKISIKILKI